MNPDEYERMFAVEERQWWYAGMRAITRSLLGDVVRSDTAGGAILDAGCGTGHNVTWLGRTAVGIDCSREAVRLSRRRGARVVHGDVTALPFRSSSFALVTSFDVLYHDWIQDDRAAVAELARVLRPGGWLFVRVPAFSWLAGAHDREVMTRHRYTVPELRALLAACGLETCRDSYANTLLLPLLVARRVLDRLLRRRGSDVGMLPGLLETLFGTALRAEALWLRRFRLPVGASAIAVARKRLPRDEASRPAGSPSHAEDPPSPEPNHRALNGVKLGFGSESPGAS